MAPYSHPLQVGWVSRNSGGVATRTVSASVYNMYVFVSLRSEVALFWQDFRFVQAGVIVAANIYRKDDAPQCTSVAILPYYGCWPLDHRPPGQQLLDRNLRVQHPRPVPRDKSLVCLAKQAEGKDLGHDVFRGLSSFSYALTPGAKVHFGLAKERIYLDYKGCRKQTSRLQICALNISSFYFTVYIYCLLGSLLYRIYDILHATGTDDL